MLYYICYIYFIYIKHTILYKHSIIQLIEPDKLNQETITNVIIGRKPNTYTFTKALAENILEREGTGLPLVIIRPSIVAASWMDPFPGEVRRVCVSMCKVSQR